MNDEPSFGRIVLLTGTVVMFCTLAILALVVLGKSFTVIPAGHVGVVTEFGQVKEYTFHEGFHVKNPLTTVHVFSTQTAKASVEASAASKDLQTVEASLAVNYHLKPETIQDAYRSVQGTFEGTLADPAIQEVVKAVTAQYTADELITKRAEVSSLIQSELSDRLSKYAVVETVSITNFDFSESFNKAIEAKVTAEQDALAAKNKLAQVQYEAEQTVTKANAEAQAIVAQTKAISEAGGTRYVQRQWIDTWNSGGAAVPSVVGAGSGGFLLNLDSLK